MPDGEGVQAAQELLASVFESPQQEDEVIREEMLGRGLVRLCDQEGVGGCLQLECRESMADTMSDVRFVFSPWSNQETQSAAEPVKIRINDSTVPGLRKNQLALFLGPTMMGVQLDEEHHGEVRKGCQVAIYPLELTRADREYVERMDPHERQMALQLHRLEHLKEAAVWYWVEILKERVVITPPVRQTYMIDTETRLRTPIPWWQEKDS